MVLSIIGEDIHAGANLTAFIFAMDVSGDGGAGPPCPRWGITVPHYPPDNVCFLAVCSVGVFDTIADPGRNLRPVACRFAHGDVNELTPSKALLCIYVWLSD